MDDSTQQLDVCPPGKQLEGGVTEEMEAHSTEPSPNSSKVSATTCAEPGKHANLILQDSGIAELGSEHSISSETLKLSEKVPL